jgi:hypothetical protein
LSHKKLKNPFQSILQIFLHKKLIRKYSYFYHGEWESFQSIGAIWQEMCPVIKPTQFGHLVHLLGRQPSRAKQPSVSLMPERLQGRIPSRRATFDVGPDFFPRVG